MEENTVKTNEIEEYEQPEVEARSSRVSSVVSWPTLSSVG